MDCERNKLIKKISGKCKSEEDEKKTTLKLTPRKCRLQKNKNLKETLGKCRSEEDERNNILKQTPGKLKSEETKDSLTNSCSKKLVKKAKLSLQKSRKQNRKHLISTLTLTDLNDSDDFKTGRTFADVFPTYDKGDHKEDVFDDRSESICPSCGKNFGKERLDQHVKNCLQRFARLHSSSGKDKPCSVKKEDPVLCQICQKDITYLNSQRRTQHLNECIDEAEAVKRVAEQEQKLLEKAKLAVLDCPMCGKSLKSQSIRRLHLKKCALQLGIPLFQMMQSVKQQEEHHQLQLAAGILPDSVKNSLKPQKPSVKEKKIPKKISKLDEDLQLAMVLSSSMTDQHMSDDHQLDSASETVSSDLRKTKKKTKFGENTPLLLTLTKQQKDERIANKVTQLIVPQDEEEDIISTPAFEKTKLSHLTAVTVFSSFMENNQNLTLWEKTGLLADSLTDPSQIVSLYYTSALMPPLEVSRVPAGSKLHRLSEIPGRSLSLGGKRKLDVDQPVSDQQINVQDKENASSEDLVVSSQTVAVLAYLAANTSTSELIDSTEKYKSTSELIDSSEKYKDTSELTDSTEKYESTSDLIDSTEKNKNTSDLIDSTEKYKSTSDLIGSTEKYKSTGELVDETEKFKNTSELVDNTEKYKNTRELIDNTEKYKTTRELIDNTNKHEKPQNGGLCPLEIQIPVGDNVVKNLTNSLACLVNLSHWSDVTIVTMNNVCLFAHKVFLSARCPKLLQMIEPGDVINLTDVSKEAMLCVLKYMYSGSVVVNRYYVSQILDLARRLELPELYNVCIDNEATLRGTQNENDQTCDNQGNSCNEKLTIVVWSDSESGDSKNSKCSEELVSEEEKSQHGKLSLETVKHSVREHSRKSPSNICTPQSGTECAENSKIKSPKSFVYVDEDKIVLEKKTEKRTVEGKQESDSVDVGIDQASKCANTGAECSEQVTDNSLTMNNQSSVSAVTRNETEQTADSGEELFSDDEPGISNSQQSKKRKVILETPDIILYSENTNSSYEEEITKEKCYIISSDEEEDTLNGERETKYPVKRSGEIKSELDSEKTVTPDKSALCEAVVLEVDYNELLKSVADAKNVSMLSEDSRKSKSDVVIDSSEDVEGVSNTNPSQCSVNSESRIEKKSETESINGLVEEGRKRKSFGFESGVMSGEVGPESKKYKMSTPVSGNRIFHVEISEMSNIDCCSPVEVRADEGNGNKKSPSECRVVDDDSLFVSPDVKKYLRSAFMLMTPAEEKQADNETQGDEFEDSYMQSNYLKSTETERKQTGNSTFSRNDRLGSSYVQDEKTYNATTETKKSENSTLHGRFECSNMEDDGVECEDAITEIPDRLLSYNSGFTSDTDLVQPPVMNLREEILKLNSLSGKQDDSVKEKNEPKKEEETKLNEQMLERKKNETSLEKERQVAGDGCDSDVEILSDNLDSVSPSPNIDLSPTFTSKCAKTSLTQTQSSQLITHNSQVIEESVSSVKDCLSLPAKQTSSPQLKSSQNKTDTSMQNSQLSNDVWEDFDGFDACPVEMFNDFDADVESSPEKIVRTSHKKVKCTPRDKRPPSGSKKLFSDTSDTEFESTKSNKQLDEKGDNSESKFKTPQRKKTKKEKNWIPPSPFTPMQDYDNMATPHLKNAVARYGLKPMCKKKMKLVLKDIYYKTHQYETDSDCDPESLTEQPVPVTLPKQTESAGVKQTLKNKTLKTAKNIDGKDKGKKKKIPAKIKTKEVEKVMLKKRGEEKKVSQKNLHQLSEDFSVSSSQESTNSCVSSDVPEESFLIDDEEISASQQTNKPELHAQLMKFISDNQDIHTMMLIYEPLELDWLKSKITEGGIKCSMQKLMDFLDEKCITFTMKKMGRNSSRRRQAKKKKTFSKSSV